jgi:hypothetical protein
MDPQLKSISTTILGYAGMALATWGVAKGLVPDADKAALANIIATAVPVIIAAAVAEYKRRTASPTALIKQVNAGDNGVKVVAASTPAPTETAPIKETK